MTFEELRKLCCQAPFVYLTLLRRSAPKRDKVRLTGSAAPLGKLCLVKETDLGVDVVACFASDDILRWLDRKGLGK